ncbi:hypothetical protein ABT336_01030 [Micromonospora sp. NPDC000207]|uniref:hypothetical protein n=1 Tax=Micromonospora sp. NPDC000207 TaxID=3154246 RepID=UPI0033228A72
MLTADGAKRVLASHGIPTRAWSGLQQSRPELFVEERTRLLEEQMRAFAAGIGVPLGDRLEGVADDDSAE